MIYSTKSNLDSAAGGCLLNRHVVDAFSLIEEMVVNQRQWSAERGGTKVNTNLGVLKVDDVTTIQAKIDAMHSMIKKIQVKSVAQNVHCEICGGIDHDGGSCSYAMENGEESEQVNVLNYDQNKPNEHWSSNTYNNGMRRDHPNFRWRNGPKNLNQHQGGGNQYQNRSNQGPPQKSNMEKMLENLVVSQTEFVATQKQTNNEVVDALRTLNNKVELLATQGR